MWMMSNCKNCTCKDELTRQVRDLRETQDEILAIVEDIKDRLFEVTGNGGSGFAAEYYPELDLAEEE
jgi:hypothetical protein